MRIGHAPNHKRLGGFTLVELLISIIIIGILVGSVIVAVDQIQAKATSTKIVADLRTLRSALVLYYSDKGAWPAGGTGTWDSVKAYIDLDVLSPTNPQNAEQQQIYATRVVQTGANAGRMFVVANVNNNRNLGIDASVRSKLEERQAEYGLLNNSFNDYKKTSMIVMVEVKR